MPRISSFYGIVIAMYHQEHGVPHFHAYYGEFEASIAIDSTELLAGVLPTRVLRLIKKWAALHTDELLENWNRAQQEKVLENIDPLP
ncbi:MAG TPA: DUF4160 domain-containing protein [Solirubrobacterales bacterium]